MMELEKVYQVGWNAPGTVYETTNRDEVHAFIDKLLDAGAPMVVINPQVKEASPQPQPGLAALPDDHGHTH